MTPQLLGNAEEHPSDKLAVVHFQPKDVVSFSRVFFCSKRISGISSCRGSLAGGGKLICADVFLRMGSVSDFFLIFGYVLRTQRRCTRARNLFYGTFLRTFTSFPESMGLIGGRLMSFKLPGRGQKELFPSLKTPWCDCPPWLCRGESAPPPHPPAAAAAVDHSLPSFIRHSG